MLNGNIELIINEFFNLEWMIKNNSPKIIELSNNSPNINEYRPWRHDFFGSVILKSNIFKGERFRTFSYANCTVDALVIDAQSSNPVMAYPKKYSPNIPDVNKIFYFLYSINEIIKDLIKNNWSSPSYNFLKYFKSILSIHTIYDYSIRKKKGIILYFSPQYIIEKEYRDENNNIKTKILPAISKTWDRMFIDSLLSEEQEDSFEYFDKIKDYPQKFLLDNLDKYKEYIAFYLYFIASISNIYNFDIEYKETGIKYINLKGKCEFKGKIRLKPIKGITSLRNLYELLNHNLFFKEIEIFLYKKSILKSFKREVLNITIKNLKQIENNTYWKEVTIPSTLLDWCFKELKKEVLEVSDIKAITSLNENSICIEYKDNEYLTIDKAQLANLNLDNKTLDFIKKFFF